MTVFVHSKLQWIVNRMYTEHTNIHAHAHHHRHRFDCCFHSHSHFHNSVLFCPVLHPESVFVCVCVSGSSTYMILINCWLDVYFGQFESQLNMNATSTNGRQKKINENFRIRVSIDILSSETHTHASQWAICNSFSGRRKTCSFFLLDADTYIKVVVVVGMFFGSKKAKQKNTMNNEQHIL